MYRFVQKGKRVVGWFFTMELRQMFDVSRYPLDEMTVKMKLEPPDLATNVVFVPDFDGYEYISPVTNPAFRRRLSYRAGICVRHILCLKKAGTTPILEGR
jgi:hypothetical protein